MADFDLERSLKFSKLLVEVDKRQRERELFITSHAKYLLENKRRQTTILDTPIHFEDIFDSEDRFTAFSYLYNSIFKTIKL